MTMPDGTTPIAQPLHQKWNELGYKLLPHLLYSPDLSPTDYHFFKHLSFMLGKHFYNQQDPEHAFQEFTESQSMDFYATGINKLFLIDKNVLITVVPILINKDVFEPSYDDLKSWSETSITCFPGDSDSKELACNAGDLSLIPRSGRSPGEGRSNPLQYSCLENSMDRRVWWA